MRTSDEKFQDRIKISTAVEWMQIEIRLKRTWQWIEQWLSSDRTFMWNGNPHSFWYGRILEEMIFCSDVGVYLSP